MRIFGKDFTINIAILLCSLLILFIIGELYLRYKLRVYPFEEKIEISNLASSEKVLLWKFPMGNGKKAWKYQIISKKQEGNFRVLFLGDSLLYQAETTSGEPCTQAIEEKVNKLKTKYKKIEIINAAVPGYTTYQELEFLKLYGLDMNPDIVVLGFVFNDVYYKYLNLPSQGGRTLGRFSPAIHLNRFNTHRFPGILFSKSYFAHDIYKRAEFFWDKINRKICGKPIFPFKYLEDFYLAWRDYGWEDVKRLIDEMASLLKSKNIKLVIVSFPIREQFNNKILQANREYVLFPQKRIKEICNIFEVPYFDLTNVIYKNGGVALFCDHLHLNPRGNDIVAIEISNYVSSMFLYESSSE